MNDKLKKAELMMQKAVSHSEIRRIAMQNGLDPRKSVQRFGHGKTTQPEAVIDGEATLEKAIDNYKRVCARGGSVQEQVNAAIAMCDAALNSKE